MNIVIDLSGFFEKIRYWMLGTVGVVWVIWNLYETNLAPFLVVAVVMFLSWILVMALSEGVVPFARNTTKRQETGILVINLVASMTISLFMFLSFPFADYHVIDFGAGGTLYGQRWFISLYNPFTDTIHNYFADKTIAMNDSHPGLSCIGWSADGRSVQGHMGVDLQLTYDGLPHAHKAAGSNSRLDQLIYSEACHRFQAGIAGYAVALMPQTLVIESDAVRDPRGMNDLGVKYTGSIVIQNLHAYFNQQ